MGYDGAMRWIVLLGLLISTSAYADRVLYCHDGDTCKLQRGNGSYFVRISGIDAPEINQADGIIARNAINRMIKNQEVQSQCNGVSYYRETCRLFWNNMDVGALLVAQGLAWDYPKYSKGLYKTIQEMAKENESGLWKNPSVHSPFCERHGNEPACQNPIFEP